MSVSIVPSLLIALAFALSCGILPAMGRDPGVDTNPTRRSRSASPNDVDFYWKQKRKRIAKVRPVDLAGAPGEKESFGGSARRGVPGAADFRFGRRLYFAKQFDRSEARFERALSAGYEPALSSLYLGKISLDRGDLDIAQRRFERVIATGGGTTLMAGHYYRSLLESSREEEGSAVDEMLVAERLAESLPASETVVRFRQAIDEALRPYRLSKWRLALELGSFYNTNIAQEAFDIRARLRLAGLATTGTNLLVTASRSGPLLGAVQTKFAYRGAFTKNFEPRASIYQYDSQRLTLTLSSSPIAAHVFGARGFVSYLLQDHARAKDGLHLEKFSRRLGAETFWSALLGKGFSNDLTVGYIAFKNLVDESLTGRSITAEEFVAWKSGKKWLRPEARVTVESKRTPFPELDYTAYGYGGANTFELGGASTLVLGVDYLRTNFTKHYWQRWDQALFVREVLEVSLSEHWTLYQRVDFTRNDSTIEDVYSYNMLAAEIGARWTL
jgi:hypothetical protein